MLHSILNVQQFRSNQLNKLQSISFTDRKNRRNMKELEFVKQLNMTTLTYDDFERGMIAFLKHRETKRRIKKVASTRGTNQNNSV